MKNERDEKAEMTIAKNYIHTNLYIIYFTYRIIIPNLWIKSGEIFFGTLSNGFNIGFGQLTKGLAVIGRAKMELTAFDESIGDTTTSSEWITTTCIRASATEKILPWQQLLAVVSTVHSHASHHFQEN